MFNMKRTFFPVFLFLISTAIYCQDYNYKPFFTVKIIDNEDTEFLFSDMRYFDVDHALKYFFWVRRGSDLGTATYQLDFKKIKSITFTRESGILIPDYTASEIKLTSGEVFNVLVNTTGTLGGMDNSVGVYGEIYMNYSIIKSIEFIHDGEYRKCPFCGALFYNSNQLECSFDRTELVPQN
ncbi:MAG: hypothetical protein GY760_06350 [Deltaproteobacteria bacterium]|nr:hypothetical protein [Deltaproteobacteria bacterium]